jgi:hypothetical protein
VLFKAEDAIGKVALTNVPLTIRERSRIDEPQPFG